MNGYGVARDLVAGQETNLHQLVEGGAQLDLESGLLLVLAAFYSSHRQPFPVKLDTLRGYVGSKNQQKAGFKVKLRTALDELVQISFLTSYEIAGDTVAVHRSAASLTHSNA